MKKSLQGQLLIASPELSDPNFFRTVVLIIKHDEEGAFGLVVNRPTSTSLKEVWSQVSQAPCERDAFLFLGGPVQGPLMAMHTNSLVGAAEVLPGVFFSPDPQELDQLVAESEGLARFYVGYAGWGAGQLEKELRESAWVTMPAEPEHVVQAGKDLWEQLTRRHFDSSLRAKLRIKHVPTSPEWN